MTDKKELYARVGIPIYVVWDPEQIIAPAPLQVFGLHIRTYEPLSPQWLPLVGLGLNIWHGEFEQVEADWLRWCDQAGNLIPLGEERAKQEKQRAEQAEKRIAQLLAQMQNLGIEPSKGNE